MPSPSLARMFLFGGVVLLAAVFAASVPGAAVSYSIAPDTCFRVVMDSTPPGSSWTITASRAFLAAVANPVEGIYYGLAVGSSHSGATLSTYDNTFSACNICPGGPLTVNFGVEGRVVPASTLGFPNPSTFPSSEVPGIEQYEAQCGLVGGDAFLDLDAIPAQWAPILGPIMIIVVIVVIVIVLPPVPSVSRPVFVRGWAGSRIGSRGYHADRDRRVGPPFGPQVVTRGSYQAETAPVQTWGYPPAPIEPGGQPIGGIGVHEGAPAQPAPPVQAPPCPRCGNPTVPAYGRWYCPTENLYPWG